MCNFYTAFENFFENAQCYITELYLVWKLKW